MNGWRHVGQVDHDGYISSALNVPDDAMLAFCGSRGIRGMIRARDVKGKFAFVLLETDVIGVTGGDSIFVATALGEHAFRPSTPAASD